MVRARSLVQATLRALAQVWLGEAVAAAEMAIAALLIRRPKLPRIGVEDRRMIR